jgi:hypothetical protein
MKNEVNAQVLAQTARPLISLSIGLSFPISASISQSLRDDGELIPKNHHITARSLKNHYFFQNCKKQPVLR